VSCYSCCKFFLIRTGFHRNTALHICWLSKRKKLDETSTLSLTSTSLLDLPGTSSRQVRRKIASENLSQPNNTLHPNKKVARKQVKISSSKPKDRYLPSSLGQRNSQLDPIEIQEEKESSAVNIERVSMDYVEKCLVCLAKLEQPIRQLSGVGPATEACFHNLGIFTLRDLLWNFPRTFIDRSKLQKSIFDVADGDVGTFSLVVQRAKVKHNSVTCTDESGNKVEVSFFYGQTRQGMIMASSAMKKLCIMESDSTVVIVSGKIKHYDQKSVLFNPDLTITPDQSDKLGIEPVYPLTSGLSQKKVVSAVDSALVVASELFKLLPESLPLDYLSSVGWPTLAEAFHLAHKPTSVEETSNKSPSRQRIAFEEISMQQAQIALSRWELKHLGKTSDLQRREPHSSWRESPLVSAAVASLPFNLTLHQDICLDELWDDAVVGADGRMLRLLQGDVGSGKTVVAYLLGLGCIESGSFGRVVTMICPTQLLASQHARTISEYTCRLKLRSGWNINVELLNGSVTGKTRDDLLLRLQTSDDKHAIFLIGTHALTTPDIIDRLKQLPGGIALSIIDEEQRFGVHQRSVLTKVAAHSLFMSATPIPRSISHKRFGLVDFTHLESDPRRVETSIVPSDSLEKVMAVLKMKIDQGSKCFWVVPRIERSKADDTGDDSTSDLNNVEDRYKMLVEHFGEGTVCHVHGRMIDKQRDAQIARFADPSTQAAILVGTTVIEGEIQFSHSLLLFLFTSMCFNFASFYKLALTFRIQIFSLWRTQIALVLVNFTN
jgi:ATP-dependent DNA helicase RecG